MDMRLGALLLLQPTPGDLSSRSRGPLLFPGGHPCLQSTQGCSRQLAAQSPASEFRWRGSGGGVGWMGRWVPGIPPAARPAIPVAPGSLASPRARPAAPAARPCGSWGRSPRQLGGWRGGVTITPALSGSLLWDGEGGPCWFLPPHLPGVSKL